MDPRIDPVPAEPTGRGALEEDAARFARFATTTASRAPLYSHLSTEIAEHPPTLALLAAAPPTQRLPVLLFAAVHWLLLTRPEVGPALRPHYRSLHLGNTPTDDPWPAFRQVCQEHADTIREVLATRSTQTNEVGRVASLLPMLGRLERQHGPLALLDVGTSAGLTLAADRYQVHYASPEHETRILGPDSPVRIDCSIRGPVPVPDRMPTIADRLGLDRSPIDLQVADDADWLRACVWPDQVDRFDRLSAAIALATDTPPPVMTGDAIVDLATAASRLRSDAHLTITTSWVLSYLTPQEQQRFATAVAELVTRGVRPAVSWCAAESPAETPGLPWPDRIEHPERTHLLLVEVGTHGQRIGRLGTAHPHGFWLHWTRPGPSADVTGEIGASASARGDRPPG